MAGHSQFKNIMHRKGAQDAKRAKLFAKLAREITVAAKSGMPDPKQNSRLRNAMINARHENMPNDKINKALQKFREVLSSALQSGLKLKKGTFPRQLDTQLLALDVIVQSEIPEAEIKHIGYLEAICNLLGGEDNISLQKVKNSLEELGLHCDDMHVLGVFEADKYRDK